MNHSDKTLQIACAKLHKAYLRETKARTFDMRSFEFQDGNKTYTKLKHLTDKVETMKLTAKEHQSLTACKESGCERVEMGIDFNIELLSRD